MPRPRFQNLAEEKRLALLEAAAKEFAEHGYEQASLNRILEAGGMSKGAAYYYFDDKADVFVTAISHYMDAIFAEISQELGALSTENFWPSFKQLYVEHLLITTTQEAWRFGIGKALYTLSDEVRSHPEIQATFSRINQWVESMIEAGQKMGKIRTDLPKNLLINLAMGIDTAIDTWFASNGANLEAQERERLAMRAAELLESVLQPQIVTY